MNLLSLSGWDLEYNKVIRHYHGHLSAVFALALHPILDVLITGGRDSVARVSFHFIVFLLQLPFLTGVGYSHQTSNSCFRWAFQCSQLHYHQRS
jgi:WD40 repeat protein